MLIQYNVKDALSAYQVITIIAAVSFFMPFFIVTVRKLFRYQPFVWFAGYWMLSGAINLLFISASFAGSRFITVTERVFNLADAPVMLFILYNTVHIEAIRKSMKKMLPAFLSTALLVTVITHLESFAEALLVGAGLIIILMYIIWIIVHYAKGIKHGNTARTLQFIYYALLFEYGISVVTFIFSYMIPDQGNLQDSFLIYHLSVIISISVASYGLLTHKKNGEEKKVKMQEIGPKAEIKFL